jgi:hypothetical protein
MCLPDKEKLTNMRRSQGLDWPNLANLRELVIHVYALGPGARGVYPWSITAPRTRPTMDGQTIINPPPSNAFPCLLHLGLTYASAPRCIWDLELVSPKITSAIFHFEEFIKGRVTPSGLTAIFALAVCEQSPGIVNIAATLGYTYNKTDSSILIFEFLSRLLLPRLFIASKHTHPSLAPLESIYPLLQRLEITKVTTELPDIKVLQRFCRTLSILL